MNRNFSAGARRRAADSAVARGGSHAVRRAVAAALLAMSSGAAVATAAEADAAKAADADSGQLQEVVVTARFRAENLQTTPIAITAIPSAQLEEKQLENLNQLGPTIPNSFIQDSHPAWGGSPTIYLRGVGQIESVFAFEPGVGIYIDDVYFSTLLGSAMDLNDLAQVEVDRGPQGTLSGKNSIGGAIRLQSRKPTGGGTGSFEATYGSFHRMDFKGSFDATLIPDTLFARVSGVSKHQDGFQTVLDFRCEMIAQGTPALAGTFPFLNANVGSGNASLPGSNCKDGENGGTALNAGKVQLRWLVSEKLEFNFSGDYSDENDGPPALSAISVPTVSPAVANTYQNTFGIAVDNRWLLSNPYQTYYQTINPFSAAQVSPNFVTKSWGYSGTADYAFTDDIRLKVIAAQRGYDASNANDRFGLPLALNYVTGVNGHDQKSVEARLSGDSFGKTLNWTLGGFWLDTHEAYSGFVDLGSSGFFSFYTNDHYSTENKSTFLHLEQKATDKLSFSAGVRYTDESKQYDYDHPGFLPAPGQPPIVANAKLTHTDWEVGADYKLTPDTFVYTTVSTGARSPGFNPRPFDAAQLGMYPAEELTSYEVGFKNDLLDHRLRLNVAAFYSDYSKLIVEDSGALQCNVTGTITPYLGGAPCPAGSQMAGTNGIPWDWFITTSGKLYGAEFELAANPIDNLSIDATFGYNHLKGDQSNPAAPDFINGGGHSMPETNGSFGAQYRVLLNGHGSVTPRLDFTYRGEYSLGGLTREPYPSEWMPSVALFNGRLTYEPEDTKWSVSFAATNLFNKFYWVGLVGDFPYTDRNTGAYAQPGISGTPSKPREWSISAKYNF